MTVVICMERVQKVIANNGYCSRNKKKDRGTVNKEIEFNWTEAYTIARNVLGWSDAEFWKD